MKDNLLIVFILISLLVLCSCDKNDKDCLSTPDNKLDTHIYDKCALHSNNNPSPKREW
jgi:nitrous oxide reductase accessory protein NosL